MVQGLPQLDFGTALQTAISRIKETEGRSRRSEFWWTMLAMMIPFVILWIINRGMMTVVPAIIVSLISAGIWFCSLPLQIRRLHDTGRGGTLALVLAGVYALQLLLSIVTVIMYSNGNYMGVLSMGTWVGLVALVYFVLFIICVVFWCQDSQPGTNQYGPSPKYPDLPQQM